MIQNVPISASNEELANSINKIINEFNNREKAIIFKDSSGVRTVSLTSEGLKTTDGTVDVNSAENSELTFNSNNNVFKIIDEGTVTLTRAASDDLELEPYEHNLGYVPAFIAFIDQGGTRYSVPKVYVNPVSGAVNEVVGVDDVNSTQIVFSALAPSGGSRYATSYTYTIKVYILQETAN